MTKCEIDFGRTYRTIRCEGHATGTIPVCAAISGLIGALAGYLANIPEGVPEMNVVYDMDDGRALLSVHDTRGIAPETVGAFDTCSIGLQQFALQYPEYIKVMVNEY